jgi:DNA-binding transcriptional LysR family regulator
MPNGVLTDTQTDTLFAESAVNWDDYRVFGTVVRAGNFHRAAIELSTTQATVSRRIESLERSLGVKLFDRPRGRGGVALTFEGRRVLKEVSAAELCLGRTKRTQPFGDGVEGDCKLLGTDGIANFWLPPFLRSFTAEHPAMQLKYFLTSDQVQNQRPPYDLQLQYLAGTEADTISHQLATLHFTFFASQEYLSQYGRPKDRSDLSRHRLLKFSSYLSDEHSWSEYSVELASQHGSVYSNSSALLAELVLAGAGISMLPTYIAVVHPRLIPVIPDYHLKSGIFLNFLKDAAKKAAVRATIDFLKEVAFDRRDMPWFRDEFELPAPEWHAIYRAHTADTNPVLPSLRVG